MSAGPIVVARVIDALESREDRLLAWGVVDGAFSRSEVEAVVQEVCDDVLMLEGEILDPEEIIEQLLRTGMLHTALELGSDQLRTRSAEAIRLMLRLRQRFPAQGREGWSGAPALVSDYRYLRRPRWYARRDIARTDALADLNLTDTQRVALESIMPPTLAGFQVRATIEILAADGQATSSATVIGAGTGSGKTWAFYLPALALLAEYHSADRWVRALAVYPRAELLRDQLQTAFDNAELLDGMLTERAGRPLRIGTLFSDTPKDADDVEQRWRHWRKVDGKGWAMPSLRCRAKTASGARCRGDLVWPDKERSRNIELVRCATCGTEVAGGRVALTRQHLQANPPDLLFLTGEMLNRSLSDPNLCELIGAGGGGRRPRMVLLDEIHTYSGTSGAQLAMLLRRWQHRVMRPVTFVGLSATLVDARRFMSALCGVPEERVTYVSPDDAELVAADAEHLLALRSDPVSNGSTLSTTIQTAMLLPRILDPLGHASESGDGPSAGLYGSRTFVFTDDLDVTNRLYYNLLDAEGQKVRRGQIQAHRSSGPLAALRRGEAFDGILAARRDGQVWDLPERIGHVLSQGLRVGRTSSQDSGVSADAPVVVATASLEVGFDDPRVGAVIQHKAPRDSAAFLQRKGRAGRPSGMRPWTVIVLSDYGRDREMYEGWDALLDPTLAARSLPVDNQQVLRMHAVQCLVDWLARELWKRGVRNARPWLHLGGPDRWGSENSVPEAKVILGALVEGDISLVSDLRRFVRDSLRLDEETVDDLLWQPPRSVLLEAVPTLLRRLEQRWAVIQRPEGDPVDGLDSPGTFSGSPLPDFFTTTLFGDLSLPELAFVVPSQTQRQDEIMPIAQGMRSFAPGRVQRRFATEDSDVRHWWGIDDYGTTIVVDPARVEHRPDGAVVVPGEATPVPVLRPLRLHLDIAPQRIANAANAFLSWITQITPAGASLELALPDDDPFGSLLGSAAFHLHAQRAQIEMRRATHEVRVELLLSDGKELRSTRTFSDEEGRRVALGATFNVDAVRFDVRMAPPELTESDLIELRMPWFLERMLSTPALAEQANQFRLEWVGQAALAALTTEAVAAHCDLRSAFDRLRPRFTEALLDAVGLLFAVDGEGGTDDEELPEADPGSAPVITNPSRLRSSLEDVLSRSGFVGDLEAVVAALWCPGDDPDLLAWVERRMLTTVGQGILEAARLSCPEHDPENLVLDLEPLGPNGEPERRRIWISEQTIGGGGAVEALAHVIRREPRRFLRLVNRAVSAGPDDEVDGDLTRFLHARDTPTLATAVAEYRDAASHAERIQRLGGLRAALRSAGLPTGRRLLVPLTARLLRPGSTPEQDAIVSDVLAEWVDAEQLLGCEIEVRTWALLAARSNRLGDLLPDEAPTQQRRYDALASILWPRGWRVRGRHLRSYNPWQESPPSAPGLVRRIVRDATPEVPADQPEAAAAIRRLLLDRGSVDLVAPPDRRAAIAAVLLDLAEHPVETEFLQVHPVPVATTVTRDQVTVRLEVRLS